MTTITENDIQELKELITNNFTSLETRLVSLKSRLTSLERRLTSLEANQFEVKNDLTEIKTCLEDWKPSINKISDLSEKVGELKNWRQIGLVLTTAVITSLFWLSKTVNFKLS